MINFNLERKQLTSYIYIRYFPSDQYVKMEIKYEHLRVIDSTVAKHSNFKMCI